ncbi:MAG: hypothetical protein ACK5V3_03125, partial [Bdellovibrionales bacterium]
MNYAGKLDIQSSSLESFKKLIKKYQFQLTGLLVSTPLMISEFNALQISLWKTSLLTLGMLAGALWIYQKKAKLQKRISEMSYQLSVGAKLYR